MCGQVQAQSGDRCLDRSTALQRSDQVAAAWGSRLRRFGQPESIETELTQSTSDDSGGPAASDGSDATEQEGTLMRRGDPSAAKPCAAGCQDWGTCDRELGECRCPSEAQKASHKFICSLLRDPLAACQHMAMQLHRGISYCDSPGWRSALIARSSTAPPPVTSRCTLKRLGASCSTAALPACPLADDPEALVRCPFMDANVLPGTAPQVA